MEKVYSPVAIAYGKDILTLLQYDLDNNVLICIDKDGVLYHIDTTCCYVSTDDKIFNKEEI